MGTLPLPSALNCMALAGPIAPPPPPGGVGLPPQKDRIACLGLTDRVMLVRDVPM